MPIFYRKAVEAVLHPVGADWLTAEHLADWRGLADALSRLTPEQRCDAIYIDWLLQLNSPARLALLQVRNLLIGSGALAANYLAELAQNANDAYDEEPEGEMGGQIRIVLDGEWLLVSNNGRKITPLNLLGLSRFFVHAAGGIVELNEQTIGRFGIGFKSCYRIASEVHVHTWDMAEHFGFRLPICREGDDTSDYDRDRLEHLIRKLEIAGQSDIDPNLRNRNWLGYCTPEFSPELPPELDEKTRQMRGGRGTLFCFRIRPDRLAEVHSRISGQGHEIYELCPLFLPKVRLVQLGSHFLRMKERRPDASHGLPGEITAVKVELTTETEGERPSNSRFWRLKSWDGSWQIALHADSEFRIKDGQEEDEHGTTIKDGAAYAYFPLNSVTKTWPFRLHLHIDLPTNLARDDWNPDEVVRVQDRIGRAVAGLAAWLEHHTDKWHPNWRFELLAARKPIQNETWAWQIWSSLCDERDRRRVVRSLGGGFVPASSVKGICMVERGEVATAWQKILRWQPLNPSPLQVTAYQADDIFPTIEASAVEVASLCHAVLGEADQDDERHRTAVLAFLGCHNLMLHRIPQVAIEFLGAVRCQSASGIPVPFTELCDQPGGAELTIAWHQTIKTIENWSRDITWNMVQIGGKSLSDQLRKLSYPKFNPAWSELVAKLATEEQWRLLGEEFWRSSRGRCPAHAKTSVLACLHVVDKGGVWLPITNLWLDDDSNVDCFGGLLREWDRPWNDAKRKEVTEKLKEWDLWEGWERSTKSYLRERLPGVLARQLAENAEKDAFALVFNKEFETSRRFLGDGWKLIVEDSVKIAVSRFVNAQMAEMGFRKKRVVSRSVSDAVSAALRLIPEFVSAPPWLTDAAFERVSDLGLLSNCDFTFLSESGVRSQQDRLVRELLEKFYQWQADALIPAATAGLQELSPATSLARRRDWQLGLGPQKIRRLRDLIAPTTPAMETTAESRLQAMLLTRAKWDGEELPASLAVVMAITEACVQSTKLSADPIEGMLTPLEVEQLNSELSALPEFVELSRSGRYRIFGGPNKLNLKWRFEGDIVARYDDAPFAIEPDRIIVHRFRPPADEEQCKRVLAVFETNSVVSRSYEADTDLSPFERYQKHRDTIRQTLLKELVTKVGYEKHHIFRELLQNAESAYASKKASPPSAWFEFTIATSPTGSRRRVTARHAGRAFNEPDVMGNPRHDVERIWRTAAESERTDDEIGRFNRGFKTLFTVASNGCVHIRSGDYAFEVIDLLMLKPAKPQPNPANYSPYTEISFETEFQDALSILRLEASAIAAASLRVVNAATFVFLNRLNRISIKFDEHAWHWRIIRDKETDGWKTVRITKEGGTLPESFLVFSGFSVPSEGTPSRRYAAAIRIGPDKLPILLEKSWRKFHLTFETEHGFPLDFLVNGDFEADQGRVNLRHIARSGLVELAYEEVIRRAAIEIRHHPVPDVWIAWARIVHLRDAPTEINASNDLKPLQRLVDKAIETFSEIIPHNDGLVAASALNFPSQLLRRLASIFGVAWGINQRHWINPDIAAALPEGTYQHKRVTFLDWILLQPSESPILRLVSNDLKSDTFAQVKLSAPEKDEFDKARMALAEKLRPAANSPSSIPEIPVVEAWSVENLWYWWEARKKSNGRPFEEYTLEGTENWRLLYDTDPVDIKQRQELLKADLLSAGSSNPSTAGLNIWYRLFGLACLMSAGRRMSEVRSFWRTELQGNQFWERTSSKSFSQGTDALFAEVTTRGFSTLNASGENAYFWRRVFYDIRKIHRLVWEDQFPATLLQLVQTGRSAELPNFLKTGFLPGQKPWVGVFGQSAGAPLFFVVRELCRLGVIQSNQEIARLAFFVSTPVRRAMERIGWTSPEAGNRVDFESLASLSDALYRRIASDTRYGPRLLPYHDIPLLHLGLEG